MANYQKYFEKFNDVIRLDNENEDLRKSRDSIKNQIINSIKDDLNKNNIETPTFFDQGSYAMKTGIKPINDECTYDIDEGMKLNINISYFSDPVQIKKMIAKSLSDHTKLGSEIREPCVRVIYSEHNKERYHVDIAIYAVTDSNNDLYRLARGKESSTNEKKYWENSQPKLLLKLIEEKFINDEERSQFKRIIRYLKRWKDLNFLFKGNSAPNGIALTTAALYYFSPSFNVLGELDDLSALINLMNKILSLFYSIVQNEKIFYRLNLKLPVEPYNDLFEKMSDIQMTSLKTELEKLKEKLYNAQLQTNEEEALDILGELFGEDFPSEANQKSIILNKLPNLGYHPEITYIPGYNEAIELIEIRCFKLVNRKFIPITSNSKILTKGINILFNAHYPVNKNIEIKWRVINTGKHVSDIANKDPSKVQRVFRGDLFYGRRIDSSGNKINVPNSLVNYEYTEYTGKHWIECLAFYNNICIAKSKPFYINIFNSDYPYYD